MRPPRTRFGAVFALAAGIAVGAASAPARPATPWYQVEAVVFAERDAARPEDRPHWREEGPPPIPENAVELLAALAPGDGGAGASRRHAFRALPASELDLSGAADRLDRSDAYRVLLHVGWRQPGFPPDDAPAVHLDSFPGLASGSRFAVAPGEAVGGTIRLWRRRFLHVDTDLAFGEIEAWRGRREGGDAGAAPGSGRREAPEGGGVSNPGAGEGAEAGAAEPGVPGPPGREEAEAAAEPRPAGGEGRRVARIAHSLRVRAGKLHYIDHPLFGVLLRVERLR